MAARRRVRLTARFYTLLLLVLVVLLAARWLQGVAMERGLQEEIERVQEELNAARAQAEQLEAEVAEMESEAYVERRAREDLGLVMPGEERYQVIPAQ